jgi:ABC-type multidrug transport system fused ATPase/permease subunit
MLGLMYRAFKQPINSLFFLALADFIVDTTILISFQLILNVVWTQPEGWNTQLSWLIALMGICMVFKYLAYARLLSDSFTLALQVRGGLSMIVMDKVLSLSSVMANRENVGKMCNIMVLDFNPILENTYAFFYSFSCILKLTVVQAIICYRFGWLGFAAVFPLILVLLYQSWISGIYGDLNEEVNEEKDKRISLYSQMLEGIKLIKLYGWEFAFKEKIQ